jgi:error-prone DNA polymerase
MSVVAHQYAELQTTTNFSFLRGGSHPQELVAQAKALGLKALAVTDRNTLAGVVRAHVAAKEAGLPLIVGVRLDFSDAPDTTPSLLCLPTDRQAYGRLCRLLSLGQARAEKGQCILRLADLAAAAQGQIFIVIPPEERLGHDVYAAFATALGRIKMALAGHYQGPLYLAASFHFRGDDHARIAALQVLADELGLVLVATGDVLYHSLHRRPLQDVLTCVRNHTSIDNAGLMLAPNAERHLRSAADMARCFKGYEAALACTVEIAERCRFSLDELVYEYPDEPVPAGKNPQAHLEQLADEGAAWRFPEGVPEAVKAALRRELDIIAQLSYAPYFLTVHDIVKFAREQGILCQGRGSAANSVVCYCLGVTAVNPMEIDLLFERFIAPERNEPPDIDVDFEHERREEVIQYIYRRYGRDRAGLAATVISYRARSAVRDVGRAMGLSEDTVAVLAGQVWGTRSGGALPDKYVRDAGLDPDDPLLNAVLTLADELIGFPRHLSQHVGGFVLTRGPLIEVVPVGNAAMADRTFIEWDKDDLDTLGLLKVDVLALGMLTCIRKAFDMLGQTHGRPMSLADVPREDPAVYDMLCRADSVGVFQVESRAQMNMLPRLKPRTFYDLVIEVAIVRPGPIQGDMVHPYLRRRDGIEAEHYPSPSAEHGPADELRQILAKTKGVPLFQEQAMRIAMEAARFNGREVNELRKAMATFRSRGTIGLLEQKMTSRMIERGYDPDFATRCFNQIKGFGEYGFPESHAASFAHLVYVSAWLKCHYPAAFCAALLNSQPMGFYAPAQLVRDARDHGVEVRGVDVNISGWDASLEPGARNGQASVRLGLAQIDGLAKADGDKILVARADILNGARPGGNAIAFCDMQDMARLTRVSPAALEKLAAADAFRSLGTDRRQALWDVRGLTPADPLPLFAWGEARERGAEAPVALPAMPLAEQVVNDYQTLRLSLKAHPMSFFRTELKRRGAASCADLKGTKDGASVLVAGVVLVRQRPGSANGVVFMTLEDETGVANTIVWPKTLEAYRRVVMSARLILVRGRVQRHEGIIHVVCRSLEDQTGWLGRLMEDGEALMPPIARADEVSRPDPGIERLRNAGPLRAHPTMTQPTMTQTSTGRHPRDVRVIPPSSPPRSNTVLPKSRDFH